MKLRLFTILFIVSSIGLYAQNYAAIAEVNTNAISVGDQFQLTFTLKNLNSNQFSLPKIEGFTVLSGPSRRMQSQFVNGKASMTTSYSYNMIADKAGTFTIPAATFSTEKGKIQSNKLTLKVTEQRTLDLSENDIFLIAEVAKDTYAVGQQVILDYNLYYNKNIEGISILKEDDYKDLSSYNLKSFSRNGRRVTIDGKPYTVSTIRKIAIFPQYEGVIEISPMRLNVNVIQEGKRQRSFFGYTNVTKPQIVTTDSVDFSVTKNPKELLVGDFWVKMNCTQQRSNTDNGIKVTVSLEGDGDPSLIEKPKFDSNKPISVFEADNLEDYTRESRGLLRTRKTWEFLLIPQDTGQYEITAFYQFYDTSGIERIARATMCYVYIDPGTYFAADSLDIAQTYSGDGTSFLNLPWWSYLLLTVLGVGVLTYFLLPTIKNKKETEKTEDNEDNAVIEYARIAALFKLENMTVLEKKKALLNILNKMAIIKSDLPRNKVFGKFKLETILASNYDKQQAARWKKLYEQVESEIYSGANEENENLKIAVQELYQEWKVENGVLRMENEFFS